MKLFTQSIACAVLSAAFLLGQAKPGGANTSGSVTGGATIARGHGALLDGNGIMIHGRFEARQLSRGNVQGYLLGSAPSVGAFIHVDVTSRVFVNGKLGLAGKVTAMAGFNPSLAVGRTAFFMVEDMGKGGVPSPDLFSELTGIPLNLGPLTAEEIYALYGQPTQFFPLVAGDIRVLS